MLVSEYKFMCVYMYLCLYVCTEYIGRCKVINTPENIALMEEIQPPQYNTGYDDEIDYTESQHDETSAPQARYYFSLGG